MTTTNRKPLNANQTEALRQFAARRMVYSNGKSIYYTALEIGISGRTLRSLHDLGYLTIRTAQSSLRGGDRNTYGLTVNGMIAANRIKRADRSA